MKSITKRITTMHSAETERVTRAWESYYELVFRELSDAELEAYVEVGKLGDEEAVGIVNRQTDLLELLEPTERWNAWIVAANSRTPGETILPHTGGPDLLPVPPPEPHDAMHRLHRAFNEADEDERRLAAAWLITVLALARAARQFLTTDVEKY